MRVILQDNVDPLGIMGDVVAVKDGYARNYLIPQGKAVPATPGELKRFENRRKKIAAERSKALEESQMLAANLKGLAVTRTVKVGDEGRLFGSVGVSEIVVLLKEKGYTFEKKQILLPEPIKAVGSYVVPVRIHPEVTTEIHVNVVKEAE